MTSALLPAIELTKNADAIYGEATEDGRAILRNIRFIISNNGSTGRITANVIGLVNCTNICVRSYNSTLLDKIGLRTKVCHFTSNMIWRICLLFLIFIILENSRYTAAFIDVTIIYDKQIYINNWSC